MDRAELSSPSVVLASGRTTEQRISVFVRQDSETQRYSETFSILPAADPGNANISPSSLSFIIPPSDLSVELTEIELEKAEDDPERISTVRAMFTVAGGLQGTKSFAVLPSTDRLIVQDGIITADQDSFSVTMGLKQNDVLNEGEVEGEVLDLIRIHHLDALRPSARMSAKIDGRNNHTCAIRTDSRIRCWGRNAAGNRSPSEGSVLGPKTDAGAFLDVSTGNDYTCAIRTNGTAECWGNNLSRQSDAPKGKIFLSVSAGNIHTCALTDSGKPRCWGADGIAQDRSDGRTSGPNAAGDRGETFLAVSAGSLHTCGIRTSGRLKCWGSNRDILGQETKQATVPDELADETFVAVSAGGNHSCAIRTNGTAECWGSNANNNQATVPAELADETFVAVSAGGIHTCGILISNTAECWGSNANNNQATVPAELANETFVAVSAGNIHTCALTDSGKPRCWGNNTDGKGTPTEDLRARISPDTPWLFEKFQDIVIGPPFIRLRIRIYLEGALR